MEPSRIPTVSIVAVAALTVAQSASAHGVLDEAGNVWMAWNVTPDIALGTLVILGLYANGARRRRRSDEPGRFWRHVSFVAGVGAIFLALQSPIDAIAERNFLVHQVQHLLVRMIGPMLIFLSFPQGALVAGLPERFRGTVVGPILAARMTRYFFGALAHPVLATISFIGVLYVWQIPELHNVALLNDYVHYAMHVSLLLAGLVFFWRVFDHRPAPMGTRYGVRLMMLWIMILSNIIIGSYLTFKGGVFYPAYDELGRLWSPALTDEQLGSMTIWIPNSMMGLFSVLIVLHMWGRQETREDIRRAEKRARYGHGWNEAPMTATELYAQTAPKNRTMALGLAAFSLSVFAIVLAIGIASLVRSN